MELPNSLIVEPLTRETRLSEVRRSKGWRHPLAAFAKRISLKEICAEVLQSQTLLSRVAASSYRHSNGFDKIIIWRDESDALIKLDVWWEGDTDWGLIHNHRFDFSSYVLKGSLQLRHYLAAKPTEDNAVDVYQLSFRQRPEELVPTRKGMLLTWEGTMPADGYYDMECNMFHQATGTAGTVTVTLVVQGGARRPYSEIVSDTPFVVETADMAAVEETPSAARRVRLNRFTEQEVTSKLERLAEL
ncbi:hypothetical protein HTZ77_03725 [Nonomuraea sp. SMC257]|uniref:Uncharacterized protein n=1 Tax=Nonomuraea montanisoli TaxID=2741721 RepID=A0A7Y6I4C2_9ACTN|nr:hypothetical protein [Nonomuraea montanisoli]NUW30535.1 hypothetical protein [Nonomuraea montanisoli]